MSRTPAAHLARLKMTYQSWTIGRATWGTGFTAERRDEHGRPRSVYARTLPELEAALAGAEQQ